MAKLNLLVHRNLCYLQQQQQEKNYHISYKAHCCGRHTCEVLHWSQSGGERWFSSRYEPTHYCNTSTSTALIFTTFSLCLLKLCHEICIQDVGFRYNMDRRSRKSAFHQVPVQCHYKSMEKCRPLEPLDLFIIHPDIMKMQLHRDWQEALESLQKYDRECTDDGI